MFDVESMAGYAVVRNSIFRNLDSSSYPNPGLIISINGITFSMTIQNCTFENNTLGGNYIIMTNGPSL